jgi:lipid II:glycine glycyltransferase (peptidoglycan interpeptide bridge formation enzyme)
MWREFHPTGWVRLSIAEYHNEPVCAGFSVPFSDVHHLWKFGWSGEYRSLRPSDMLHWESILWAKGRGFKQLDLTQIDPEIATALASGEPVPPALQTRRLYGPTLYKTGFGGRVMLLPGTYSYFLNPLLRYAYSALGARLLRQEGFIKKLGRMAERVWGGSVGT